MSNKVISCKNSEFWNELCGTQLACVLGITDSGPASLKKFDDWYFDFYPYLYDHIPFNKLNGQDVLEVGLGYGTVSQKLAESGAKYHGLDIAVGPVEMTNHRLQQAQLSGKAILGSILEPPFEHKTFDTIIAIGCLHHTGDMSLAIDRCWELLRPDGRLIFMVYYAYSYRRLRIAFKATMSYFFRELGGYRGVSGIGGALERAAYDANSAGACAPHTDWISVKSLASFCNRFQKFEARRENIDQEPPFQMISRKKLLVTPLPHILGLDLYVTAVK